MGQTMCAAPANPHESSALKTLPSIGNPSSPSQVQNSLAQQSEAFASFLADIPLRKVYIHDYQRRLGLAQDMTTSEGIHDGLLQVDSAPNKVNFSSSLNLAGGPAKAKHIRSVFVHAFGKSWLDVGRKNTELNLMLSSPIFRHSDDVEVKVLRDKIIGFLPETPTTPKENEKAAAAENATLKAIKEHQATEDTLLDVPQLILLGVLYCKGSRVGKSSLLFPLITRNESDVSCTKRQEAAVNLIDFDREAMGRSEEVKEVFLPPYYLGDTTGSSRDCSSRHNPIGLVEEKSPFAEQRLSIEQAHRMTYEPFDAIKGDYESYQAEQNRAFEGPNGSLTNREHNNIERLTFGLEESKLFNQQNQPQQATSRQKPASGRNTHIQPQNSRQGTVAVHSSRNHRNHHAQSNKLNQRHTINEARPQATLLKTSLLLKETFIALVQLSTQLVDPTWDESILEQCASSLPYQQTPTSSQASTTRENYLDQSLIRSQQAEIVSLVHSRMYKKFAKELFKGCQKENQASQLKPRMSERSRKKQQNGRGKQRNVLTKEQFCYQMDDGTQVSKYLLDPAFLRELYLFELATTVALMREDMLQRGPQVCVQDIDASRGHMAC